MNNPAQNSNWLSDPDGRINNISLAPNPKNALIPLFETIMNSIHAIEERFGKNNFAKGEISIEIMRDKNGENTGFIVTDNGIGFNNANLESFQKMDSQKKVKLGGKGVGRLLWLKVMKEVRISSTFSEDKKCKNLKFDFTAQDPLLNMQLTDVTDISKIGTRVELHPYRGAYATCLPKRSATIVNRVLAHFIRFFINISHPKITIIDKEELDLFEKFSGSIERDKDYAFEVLIANEQRSFTLHCFLLPKEISDDEVSTNALYLGANGRAVERVDLDTALGFRAVEGKFAFLGYVESDVLDDSANDTRTDFSLDKKTIDEIINEAKNCAKDFLDPEIQQVRVRQRKAVIAIRKEHPRFLSVTQNMDEFMTRLRLSTQKEEDIYLELSRRTYRQYTTRKNGYAASVKHNLSDIKEKSAEWVKGLQVESMSSLAEYVKRRELILKEFKKSLQYTNIEEEKSAYEEVIHNIICPMGASKEDLNYEDHNLWILDDRLAFFTYFNSDKKLIKQVKNPESPNSRPDLTAFEMLEEGFGFQNNDASQPVTIIEFKRPKRDDYTPNDNPIEQVRNYVENIKKSEQVIKHDGTPLRPIDETTQFHCHIIADITPTLKEAMKRAGGGFHKKTGAGCYYKWDEAYKIFIEISSFAEVLKSAEARNEAFFRKLGLT